MTTFQSEAHKLNIPSAAVAEVLVMARKHSIDLNSVTVESSVQYVGTTVQVGEQRTGNFIIVTKSPIMTTVARYTKVGAKTVRPEIKSF